MFMPFFLLASTFTPTEASAPAPEPTAEEVGTGGWEGLGTLLDAPTAVPNSADPQSSSATQRSYDSPRFVDENAWYLRLDGGLVTTANSDGPGEEIDFDEGFLVALALGHHFGAQEGSVGFDLEVEGVWTDQDTSGDVSSVRDYNSISALVNALIEFRIAERFFFYGGAGLGAAFVDVGTNSSALGDFNADDGPFLTWQAKAGFLYRFAEHWDANLGYRFVNINNIEIMDSVGTSNFDLETEQHVLELGFGYRF